MKLTELSVYKKYLFEWICWMLLLSPTLSLMAAVLVKSEYIMMINS